MFRLAQDQICRPLGAMSTFYTNLADGPCSGNRVFDCDRKSQRIRRAATENPEGESGSRA
jgi:hypothetical protein